MTFADLACPNTPPCPHWAGLHDIDDYDDPTPKCCVDGCTCGHPTREDDDRDQSRWAATQTDDTTVHVTPLDDLVDHLLDETCPCVPRDEPVDMGDGQVGWICVHHSLDGREANE